MKMKMNFSLFWQVPKKEREKQKKRETHTNYLHSVEWGHDKHHLSISIESYYVFFFFYYYYIQVKLVNPFPLTIKIINY